MAEPTKPYAARLDIDYPGEMDRLTTLFRALLALPIIIILALVSGPTSGGTGSLEEANEMTLRMSDFGIAGGFFIATALMILFRQVYPRWWFDFVLELNRFSTRVGAYILLLTDRYPSTTDEQTVRLELDYPDVKKELSQWMPLFKWVLAIPHYFVLLFLGFGLFFTTIVAWFAILFTGRYPKGLFEYAVGVQRWGARVGAYAFLLLTDKYPPFSLK